MRLYVIFLLAVIYILALPAGSFSGAICSDFFVPQNVSNIDQHPLSAENEAGENDSGGEFNAVDVIECCIRTAAEKQYADTYAAVPEPSTMAIFGTGIIGILLSRR
ncbi:PEP-CTERM motif protein [Limihaloglobus sulfuriphilus]|uniref:PEP-CTERM motif protein n=1 Tax=Limihaloglobus sulfuriphilus TaxID=1851148 RepID=A0A1Q2MC92_9BACT|nr:PEP-CTERM sorting domain-containing protein [Limihaloglobus sulfuriphilus]AQQ70279.1 PEP-CTERM motif protein [Limihaloglobus sulfuriphilus]